MWVLWRFLNQKCLYHLSWSVCVKNPMKQKLVSPFENQNLKPWIGWVTLVHNSAGEKPALVPGAVWLQSPRSLIKQHQELCVHKRKQTDSKPYSAWATLTYLGRGCSRTPLGRVGRLAAPVGGLAPAVPLSLPTLQTVPHSDTANCPKAQAYYLCK